MKKIIMVLIFAACLCVPAFAANVAPENKYTGADIGYMSQYAPPPQDEIEKISQTTGSLYINLKTAGLCDLDARQVTIASYYDDTIIHGELGVDGKYDVRLPSGKYAITLPKGTGSDVGMNSWKQETQDATVAPSGHEYISFIGACISGRSGAACIPQIYRAQYGALVCHDECEAVNNHVLTWNYMAHWTWHVTCNNPNHHGIHHLEWSCWHGTHQDCEQVCEGQYADVTADVQWAVNHGYTSFKFDNAQNPGGIFTADNKLLREITDPAPGSIKEIAIDYTPCGGKETTSTFAEYQFITL